MSDIERLRRSLKCAARVAAIKRVHDQACELAKKAAEANDLALLDECTSLRFAASRTAGTMLLAGAERVPGVDSPPSSCGATRAQMNEIDFAARVRKAQTMQRRLAGEPPSPRILQRSGAEPQARTLRSPWRLEGGFPTRYIVGVDLSDTGK